MRNKRRNRVSLAQVPVTDMSRSEQSMPPKQDLVEPEPLSDTRLSEDNVARYRGFGHRISVHANSLAGQGRMSLRPYAQNVTSLRSALAIVTSRRHSGVTDKKPRTGLTRQLSAVKDFEERQNIIQMIRLIPCPIEVKRDIVTDEHRSKQAWVADFYKWHRRKAAFGTIRHLPGLAGFLQWQQGCFRRWRGGCHSFLVSLLPWNKTLRSIEGLHGAGVVAYFEFLRYQLLVNVCLCLISAFIWVPTLIFPANPYPPNTTVSTCSERYTIKMPTDLFSFALQVIQGQGWFEKTFVFYGYYGGNGLVLPGYPLSLVYILVVIFSFAVSLMLMGRFVTSRVTAKILNQGGEANSFCNKLFGGWDFTLVDEDATRIKHKSIRNELMSDLMEQRFLKERDLRLHRKRELIKLLILRFFINTFIVSTFALAIAAIFYATVLSTKYAVADILPAVLNVEGVVGRYFMQLLVQYLPAIAITFFNSALPLIYDIVVQGEDYTSEFVMKITLLRVVVLRLASLGVMVIAMHQQITCGTPDMCMTTQPPCNVIKCWETYVGQQFFKLIITDFLCVISRTLLYEFPRRAVYDITQRGVMRNIGPPEFHIPTNVLDLVYSQCLYWLALTFVPISPCISVFQGIVTIYVKLLSALKACPPAKKPVRAARSTYFFMTILLASLFLCTIPIGYAIYGMKTSKGCGPFRTKEYMYNTVTDIMVRWGGVSQAYSFLLSPAVTIPIIVLLWVIIEYRSALASAHKDMSDLYREQLAMEGRDKQYLLHRVRELSGEKRPLPRQNLTPNWKYTNNKPEAATQTSGDYEGSPAYEHLSQEVGDLPAGYASSSYYARSSMSGPEGKWWSRDFGNTAQPMAAKQTRSEDTFREESQDRSGHTRDVSESFGAVCHTESETWRYDNEKCPGGSETAESLEGELQAAEQPQQAGESTSWPCRSLVDMPATRHQPQPESVTRLPDAESLIQHQSQTGPAARSMPAPYPAQQTESESWPEHDEEETDTAAEPPAQSQRLKSCRQRRATQERPLGPIPGGSWQPSVSPSDRDSGLSFHGLDASRDQLPLAYSSSPRRLPPVRQSTPHRSASLDQIESSLTLPDIALHPHYQQRMTPPPWHAAGFSYRSVSPPASSQRPRSHRVRTIRTYVLRRTAEPTESSFHRIETTPDHQLPPPRPQSPNRPPSAHLASSTHRPTSSHRSTPPSPARDDRRSRRDQYEESGESLSNDTQ